MRKMIGVSLSLMMAIAAIAITSQPSDASDHDDGETDAKSRALNLTDHFAFRSPSDPSELSLVMYFNPRSLPGRQYFLSGNARYEFHVTKVGSRADAVTAKDDFVFRFEAGPPGATGIQNIQLTVLRDDGAGRLTEVGSMMGSSTDFANSKANTVTVNTGAIGGLDVEWFVGQRADSFHFDVVRFFEVRSFLAQRFFGKGVNRGDATAGLGPNCRGDQFLALGDPTKEAGGVPDHDVINLFNPPSCAPDFTKGLNVTAIVLNVKIAQLGASIFDTWSTVSTRQ
jgi:hypothetical protein